jgi:uncharacterized protein
MAENFIKYCLESIVMHTDALQIEVKSDADATRYQVTVHPDDMRRVIGRGGRTIRALQSLVRVIGMKTQSRAYLNLVEP